MIETKPFDAAETLVGEERNIVYLEEAFETNDPALIASAIGDVARAASVRSRRRPD